MLRSPIRVPSGIGRCIGSGAPLQPAAADPPPGDPEPWRINLALYGWAMNVSGNVTVRNQTLDTNASTLDLLQKSNSLSGFMGYFEADKGRAGLYADLVYASLGFGADQVGYRNPIAGLKITHHRQRGADLSAVHRRGRRPLRDRPLARLGRVIDGDRWPARLPLLEQFDRRHFRCDGQRRFLQPAPRALVRHRRRALERRAMGRSGARPSPAPPLHAQPGVLRPGRHRRLRPRQPVQLAGGRGLQLRLAVQRLPDRRRDWFPRARGELQLGLGRRHFGINEVLYGPIIGASFRF